MTHKIITDRELALALGRENARQLQTIRAQSISIEILREEIEGWISDQRENLAATVKQEAVIEALQEEINQLKVWDTVHSAMLDDYIAAVASQKSEIEGWKADQKENMAVAVYQQAEINALGVDAARYQWMRSATELDLRSDGSTWSREGNSFVAPFSLAANGTRYGAYPTLDELIDNAMKETK
jgi:hypothetical protein